MNDSPLTTNPGQLAAVPSPPRRPLTFPPEVILHILSFISNSPPQSRSEPAYVTITRRNAALARLALVSRPFQQTTYSVLYGDLRIPWMADKVHILSIAFEDNPSLPPLVLRLEAAAVQESMWITNKVDAIAREDVHGKLLARAGNFNALEKLAGAAWVASGHGAWRNFGVEELGDLVAKVAGVRDVVAEGFALPFGGKRFVEQGPYPQIRSLEIHIDSELISGETFAASLASLTPNLRYLSVSSTMAYIMRTAAWTAIQQAPAAVLPLSITHLTLAAFHPEDTIPSPLLRQAQHSLQSITLVAPFPTWSRSKELLKSLSSVKIIVIRNIDVESPNDDVDVVTLASTISSSSSLRHFEVVGTAGLFNILPPSHDRDSTRHTSTTAAAVATLIASLPSSLETLRLLTLTEIVGRREHIMDASEMLEQTLGMLKGATPRPLRVEFVRPPRTWTAMAAAAALDEWRDAYTSEGITLALSELDEESYM